MTETAKIVITACATIGGGLVLFGATTVVQKLIFEPMLVLRKALGDVSFCLQYHAWVFHTGRPSVPPERLEKVFDELRMRTARMRADANAVLCYGLFAKLGWIPSHENLIEAAGSLIRLSNTLGQEKWDLLEQDMDAVEKLLRIDIGRRKYKPNKSE